jgi:hypothetical protein
LWLISFEILGYITHLFLPKPKQNLDLVVDDRPVEDVTAIGVEGDDAALCCQPLFRSLVER